MKGKREAARRRKADPAFKLKIAQAQLRAIRGLKLTRLEGADFDLSAHSTAVPFLGPARFIMCWAVQRGYSGITQALDGNGQVWERTTLMEEVLVDGKKVKQPKESWWEPLSMERREAKKDEP